MHFRRNIVIIRRRVKALINVFTFGEMMFTNALIYIGEMLVNSKIKANLASHTVKSGVFGQSVVNIFAI